MVVERREAKGDDGTMMAGSYGRRSKVLTSRRLVKARPAQSLPLSLITPPYDRLKPLRWIEHSIRIRSSRSSRFTGAVRSPCQYYVPPSATLVDVLALAGEATSEINTALQGGASDLRQVRLVRDGVGTVIDLRPLTILPEVIELLVQSG